MKGLLLVAVCGLLAGMVFAGGDTGPAKIQRLRSSFLERALDMLDDEDASQQYLDEVVRIQAMQTEADMDQRVTVFEGKITAAMHDALRPGIMDDIGDGDSFSEQQLSHIDEAAAILKGQEDRLNAWRESQHLSPVFLRQVNGITYQYPRYISFFSYLFFLLLLSLSNSLLFLDDYFFSGRDSMAMLEARESSSPEEYNEWLKAYHGEGVCYCFAYKERARERFFCFLLTCFHSFSFLGTQNSKTAKSQKIDTQMG